MTAAASTASGVQIVPGRECGSCALCCKVYNIVEISKPAGKWCAHCKPGRGCKIHDNLPGQCAAFNCLWRTDPAVPAQWKPDQAKMVATIHPLSKHIQVQVDPGLPSAWSRQPYHDHLRQWATKNMPKGIHVIVFVNDQATLILPDQDVQLGPLTAEQIVSVVRQPGPNLGVYEIKISTIRTTPDGQTFEVASTSRHAVRSAA